MDVHGKTQVRLPQVTHRSARLFARQTSVRPRYPFMSVSTFALSAQLTALLVLIICLDVRNRIWRAKYHLD